MRNPLRHIVAAFPVLLFAGSACSPGEITPPPPGLVTLLVRANVSATSVALVVVEVTAPDIDTPLVFNIPVTAGVASGTVTVPAGSDRTFTMRAFDSGGIETHAGSRTVDVAAGANPAIVITLLPLSGDVPIDATLGTVTVLVVPPADTLAAPDDTVTLTGRVFDSKGDPVTDPLVWATLDPSVATVERTSDSTGLVTGQGPGTTQVVATFAGVGDAADIVVSAVPALQLVAGGLNNPLFATAPPNDPTRLFVVEQPGRILVIRNDILLPTPFLDIQSLVLFGGERGLLGMAFHPSYATNGFFYVNYTDVNGDTRVVRYTVSADPDVADASSAAEILFVGQPSGNHNGGMLTFGPDGMLYIGLGDGGGAGDPNENGQDSTTLLGSMLRVDVDGGFPYVIPPDNPFVGSLTAREEIWAYGLRNPWRYSFDRTANDLYIADVGQAQREEVDIQPSASAGGENYGWNTMEGTLCFDPPSGCNQTGLILPDFEFSHLEGCSITGGYVYRGSALPALVGLYFYGDFCNRWVRSFRYASGSVSDHRDWTPELGTPGSITSFGQDANGELYIVTQEGNVFRIVPTP